VTLRDSGEFGESFVVDYRGNEFVIEATDFKKQYLVQKYGDDIFGLTIQNIDRLSADIKEDFITAIKQIIA